MRIVERHVRSYEKRTARLADVADPADAATTEFLVDYGVTVEILKTWLKRQHKDSDTLGFELAGRRSAERAGLPAEPLEFWPAEVTKTWCLRKAVEEQNAFSQAIKEGKGGQDRESENQTSQELGRDKGVLGETGKRGSRAAPREMERWGRGLRKTEETGCVENALPKHTGFDRSLLDAQRQVNQRFSTSHPWGNAVVPALFAVRDETKTDTEAQMEVPKVTEGVMTTEVKPENKTETAVYPSSQTRDEMMDQEEDIDFDFVIVDECLEKGSPSMNSMTQSGQRRWLSWLS